MVESNFQRDKTIEKKKKKKKVTKRLTRMTDDAHIFQSDKTMKKKEKKKNDDMKKKMAENQLKIRTNMTHM